MALEAKQCAYKHGIALSYSDLSLQLTELKKEFTWLKETSSLSLQASLRNLDTAYRNFFKYKYGFPKFKSKHNKQSFQCPSGAKISFNKELLYIPKFKDGIKLRLHRKFKGNVRTVTITKTKTGKYFASILIACEEQPPIKRPVSNKQAIGVDLGISTYLTLSNNTKVDNPKYFKSSLKNLAKAQRRLSKKVKGSNRYVKQQVKVAKQYEKVFNQRNDFLQKLSTKLIKEYDTICVEDLAVSNMVKNHCLAQLISDASWFTFVQMLEYKALWYGNNLLKVSRFFPSSKLCNHCGNKNAKLILSDRTWVCEECGAVLDRDINAATNILDNCLKNWRMEHTLLDTEVVNYHTDEVSKNQDNIIVNQS